MKLTMKNTEEKAAASPSSGFNPKVRIAVIGQHDVGKSALTVRYLTKRYIGEYKSNSDLLYRQTLNTGGAYGSNLDIEIIDVATSGSNRRRSDFDVTFPEDFLKADAFIIVYSITDRKSFAFAHAILSTLLSRQAPEGASVSPIKFSSSAAAPTSHSSSTPPIFLLANKSDLEHLRSVEKSEGVNLAAQFGCSFHEISVAENSPELYQAFQSTISTFSTHLTSNTSNSSSGHHNSSTKRKFSVSKMLGNLRLGRTSPCHNQHQILTQASIIETCSLFSSSSSSSAASSDTESSAPEPVSPSMNSDAASMASSNASSSSETCSLEGGEGVQTDIVICCTEDESAAAAEVATSEGSNEQHCNNNSINISSSICNLKSKIVEFHTLRKRHNSPPICSL